MKGSGGIGGRHGGGSEEGKPGWGGTRAQWGGTPLRGTPRKGVPPHWARVYLDHDGCMVVVVRRPGAARLGKAGPADTKRPARDLCGSRRGAGTRAVGPRAGCVGDTQPATRLSGRRRLRRASARPVARAASPACVWASGRLALAPLPATAGVPLSKPMGLPAAAPVVPEGVAATGITSMLVNVARAPVVVVVAVLV